MKPPSGLYSFVFGSMLVLLFFLGYLVNTEHEHADKWRHLAEQAAKNCSESSDRP